VVSEHSTCKGRLLPTNPYPLLTTKHYPLTPTVGRIVKPLTQLSNATASELLPPCAATLAVMSGSLSEVFSLRAAWCPWNDPGALQAALQLPANSSCRALLHQLAEQSNCRGDWEAADKYPTYFLSQTVGLAAAFIAAAAQENTEEARAAGVLAPLGSLVRVQEEEPQRSPADDFLLTRRLVRRWSLPPWLSHTLLHLDFPVEPDYAETPENRRLLVVQAALAFVQEESGHGFVPIAGTATDLITTLGLPATLRQELVPLLKMKYPPPAGISGMAAILFRRLLGATTAPKPADSSPSLEELETELETLRGQLTRRRQQEQSHFQDQKLAALAEFAAGASHEINNPLAVISAQAQHLLKTEESLERAKGLERIITQAKRIHTLLRDLMLYARPPEITCKPVNVRSLVRSAMEKVTQAATIREVRVEAASIPARLKVNADADLLEVALVCLLQNAVAAAPAQGWVKLTLETDASASTVFVVEDNGPGLAAEARPHLFDPFYSALGAGRGAGLGLSKVWRIAQLHGGRVEFISEPPQPTRFVLRLPGPVAQATPRIAAQKTRRK
jgi:two-component system, NtrC family, sensor kinase